MSFAYPRTVTITRSAVDIEIGQPTPYGGLTPEREVTIARDVPASIQLYRPGSAPVAGLPADSSRSTTWKILIPMAAIPLGKIKTHDVLTDDTDVRYQVSGPYWTSLGYQLLCERLEI